MDFLLDYLLIFFELAVCIVLLIMIYLGIAAYFKGTKFSNIFVILLGSLLVHTISTLIAGILILYFLVGPEPRPLEKIPLGLKITGLIIFLIYSGFCWFLCSFVKRKLTESVINSERSE